MEKESTSSKMHQFLTKKKEVKTETSSLEKEHTEDISPKEEQVLDT